MGIKRDTVTLDGGEVGVKPLFADPTAVGASVSAPAAAAVIADTGALAAGTYRVDVQMGYSGVVAAGKHIVAEHRNAANAANIREAGLCPAGQASAFTIERVVIAANERIRVVAGAVAGGVGEVAHASIRAYLL